MEHKHREAVSTIYKVFGMHRFGVRTIDLPNSKRTLYHLQFIKIQSKTMTDFFSKSMFSTKKGVNYFRNQHLPNDNPYIKMVVK